MNSNNFEAWVLRCIKLVREFGISETETFLDEVIFTMEDGAEKELDPYEREKAEVIIRKFERDNECEYCGKLWTPEHKCYGTEAEDAELRRNESHYE